MSINLNDLNYENTVDKRFYLRENGQIICKYDFFNEDIKNLGPNQELLMEDRTDSFALPEFWYYRINCPTYIIVTDISSYNTVETDIGKSLSLDVTSQTSGNEIVLTFDIKHNNYTHISQATDLSSQSDLAGVTTEVQVGTDSSITENNIAVHINEIDAALNINIISGKASLVLNGSQVTTEQLSGYITLSNGNDLYFTVSNIQLTASVADATRMRELREERNSKLNAIDRLIIRHITQQTIGETTLSNAQFEDLCNYMQDLRDLPATVQNLSNIEWPEIPQSLTNIL